MPEILDYTGNVGLGLGANPDIPVSASPNTLDVLAQTSRDIANRANQVQSLLYEQKVKDRNALLEMIAKDEVSVGNIIKEYRPEVEKALDEQRKAFNEWGGDFNDVKGYQKYKDATQKAGDLAKVAQLNTATISSNRALMKNKSKRVLNDYLEFENREIGKGLTDIVNPYVEINELNFDDIVGDLNAGSFGNVSVPDVTKKTTITDKGEKSSVTQTITEKQPSAQSTRGKQQQPVGVNESGELSPMSKLPDNVYNFDNTLGRAVMRFVEGGKGKDQQDLIVEGVEGIEFDKVLPYINSINDRINTYNEQTKGVAKRVEPLREGVDYSVYTDPVDNKKYIKIESYKPEFVAKVALAQHKGDYLTEGGTAFNKDVADYLKGLADAQYKMAKLGIDGIKARAYARGIDAKVKRLEKLGIDEADVESVANSFVEQLEINPVSNTPDFDMKPDKFKDLGGVFFMDRVPTNYDNVVMSIDYNGKMTNKKVKPFDIGGRKALMGTVYDLEGRPYDFSKESLENEYKRQKLEYEQKNRMTFGSFDDWLYKMQRHISNDIKQGRAKVILKDADENILDINSIKDAYKNLNRGLKTDKERMFSEEILEPKETEEN